MREAVGGTWLFQIAIVFIILFSGYLALSVNYSRAFKVKNEILAIIERNEGLREKSVLEINNYLVTVNHTVVGNCAKDFTGFGQNGTASNNKTGIYCIRKTCVTGDVVPKAYYKVTVFFKFDLPVIGDIFTFRVDGETKTIYNTPDPADDNIECLGSDI